MSAQNTYRYNTPIGVAGGIVDIAPYAIDTFINEENDGVMQFGVAVMRGTKAGVEVLLPATVSSTAPTAAKFEGITTNNRTTEYDMAGDISIKKGVPIGVMRYGRIYAKLATGITPAYGDPVYFIYDGTEAGCFANASGTKRVAVKGRFLSTANNGVAVVELFNEAQ